VTVEPALTKPSLKTPRRWVHIPIEVKVRELESRTLLACHFAEAGYGVIVGQQTPLMRRLPKLPRGLYVDKCLSPQKRRNIHGRKRLGYLNASVDEEALAAEFDREFYVRSRYSAANLADCDLAFCWGTLEAGLVAAQFPEAASKLRAVGNPRVDLWRHVFAGMFEAQAEQLRREHGGYVLIPSSFGEVAMTPDSAIARTYLDLAESQSVEQGDTTGAYARHFRASIDHMAGKFGVMSAALAKLFAVMPEQTFILRPHPADRADIWHDKFDRFANVRIIHAGPVAPWIMAAQLVVHSGCSTAIESYFLGKPLITYLENHDARFDDWLSNGISRQTRDPAGLIAAVRAALADPATAKVDADAHVARVLSVQGDRTACDAMVAAAGELDWPAAPLRYRPRLVNKAWRDFWRGSPAVHQPRRWLGRFNQREHSRTYSRQKFPVLRQGELDALIARFAGQMGRFDGIVTRPLDHNLYAMLKPAAD